MVIPGSKGVINDFIEGAEKTKTEIKKSKELKPSNKNNNNNRNKNLQTYLSKNLYLETYSLMNSKN